MLHVIYIHIYIIYIFIYKYIYHIYIYIYIYIHSWVSPSGQRRFLINIVPNKEIKKEICFNVNQKSIKEIVFNTGLQYKSIYLDNIAQHICLFNNGLISTYLSIYLSSYLSICVYIIYDTYMYILYIIYTYVYMLHIIYIHIYNIYIYIIIYIIYIDIYIYNIYIHIYIYMCVYTYIYLSFTFRSKKVFNKHCTK